MSEKFPKNGKNSIYCKTVPTNKCHFRFKFYLGFSHQRSFFLCCFYNLMWNVSAIPVMETPRSSSISLNYLQWWRKLRDFIKNSPMSHINLLFWTDAIIANCLKNYFAKIMVVNLTSGKEEFHSLVMFLLWIEMKIQIGFKFAFVE